MRADLFSKGEPEIPGERIQHGQFQMGMQYKGAIRSGMR